MIDARSAQVTTLEDTPVSGTLGIVGVEWWKVTLHTWDVSDVDYMYFAIDTEPGSGGVSLDGPLAEPLGHETGDFTYAPATDANGTDTFVFSASDYWFDSGRATVTVHVTPVNDAPSFQAGADQDVEAGAGPQTVSGWATAISAGPADEASQQLSFAVTGNTNPGLFASAPTIDPDGTLTYESSAVGSATLTVVLQDDGGTENGGVDVSSEQSFSITVTPPPPTALPAALSTLEDNPAGGVLTSSGGAGPVSYAIATQPAGGTVTLDDAATGASPTRPRRMSAARTHSPSPPPAVAAPRRRLPSASMSPR